jgi:hypothetical protein
VSSSLSSSRNDRPVEKAIGCVETLARWSVTTANAPLKAFSGVTRRSGSRVTPS